MNSHPEISGRTTPAPQRLNTQAEIHELLASRRSTRAFSREPIEPWKIMSLFEAARWSPSSANEQPWYFIAAIKDDFATYSALLESLSERNRRWASNAPMLVLALAQSTYSRSGQPYRHSLYDLGQSVALLSVQAIALGLSVHEMGGFDPEKFRRVFPVPEGFDPVVIFAVGYPDAPDSLPEDLRARERAPRSRKPLESFVFTERWGKPSHHIQPQSVSSGEPSRN